LYFSLQFAFETKSVGSGPEEKAAVKASQKRQMLDGGVSGKTPRVRSQNKY
jgi:hypothetical protein